MTPEETTEAINYGGAAFPCEGGEGSGLYPDPGMSMRDWFAGQALAGLCAHHGSYGIGNGPGELADRAHEIADAMIAARKIGGAA